MPTLSRLTALAVARTMLAGSADAAGLAARMRACLDADAGRAMPIALRAAGLHNCVTDGPAAQKRDRHPRWREHLQGRVAWATQLNPAKALSLKRLFDQIGWSR